MAWGVGISAISFCLVWMTAAISSHFAWATGFHIATGGTFWKHPVLHQSFAVLGPSTSVPDFSSFDGLPFASVQSLSFSIWAQGQAPSKAFPALEVISPLSDLTSYILFWVPLDYFPPHVTDIVVNVSLKTRNSAGKATRGRFPFFIKWGK